MTVRATKGLTVHMSGDTVQSVVPTAISSAKPAVVTVADTTGMKDGQMVVVYDSGIPAIDGKLFLVNALSATDFELLGSDTSGGGTMGANPRAEFYDDAINMVPLCLSSIGVNSETGSPVSVATFCEPTATIPGLEGGAGTLDLGFYLDVDAAGYAALLAAEADGNEREFKINFPSNGSLLMQGIVSSVNFTEIPLEGSVALTAQITLSAKPNHVF